jgi:hypothetical protein
MHATYYAELLDKGYTVIPQVYDANTVAILKQKIVTEWDKVAHKPLSGQNIPGLNQGHKILYNLQNKDIYFFQIFIRHPLLRALLIQCLNDQWYKQIPQENPNFILRSLLGRSSGPAPMPLHIDSFIPNPGMHITLIQSAIVLENQNKENGCTLAVPGSHQFGRYATQDWVKYAAPIESQAGDVVMWDSRLWHGAYGNSTNNSRWSVIATFSRWWVKQNYDITGSFPKEFLEKISDEEKSVIGFCSAPPRDEHDRLDIKAGYEIFQKELASEI